MAMGNFCYIQSIECPYATALGTCRDDIYSDFNKCEMNGDDMPPIEWLPHERRSWCANQHAQLGSPLHLHQMRRDSAENKSILPVLQSKNVRVKMGG